MSSTRRLGPIDPENNYSIYAAALSLLALFSDSLLEIIEEKFSKLYGKDWQQQFISQELLSEDQNLRDVHALLKELSQKGQSQLRIPITERVVKHKRQNFYDELANILAERNAWVHRHVQESKRELMDLAKTIRLVSEMAEVSSFQQCDELIESLSKQPEKIEPSIEIVEAPQLGISSPKSELKVGDPIHTQFTSHSYLITPEFDVVDRVSGLKLSQVNKKTLERLGPNLKKLRPGSRLRLTQDGTVSAFFAESWGFLEQITAEEWFPLHVNTI